MTQEQAAEVLSTTVYRFNHDGPVECVGLDALVEYVRVHGDGLSNSDTSRALLVMSEFIRLGALPMPEAGSSLRTALEGVTAFTTAATQVVEDTATALQDD